MRHFIQLTVALSAAVVLPLSGAEDLRDTVVVTASRLPVPLIAAGSSVSVIDREQIEARQATFAVDLLNRSLISGFLPLELARGAGLHVLNAIPGLKHAVMERGLAPRTLPRLMQPASACPSAP